MRAKICKRYEVTQDQKGVHYADVAVQLIAEGSQKLASVPSGGGGGGGAAAPAAGGAAGGAAAEEKAPEKEPEKEEESDEDMGFGLFD